MNEENFIEFNGNKAVSRLNELDLTDGKTIGGTNVYYNLRVERTSEKGLKMAVWNGENSITSYLICNIEDVPRKLTNKKTSLVSDLIDLFGEGELPPTIEKRLRATARIIQQKWIDSVYTQIPGFQRKRI